MLAVSQLHALLFFLIGIINKRSAPNNPIEVSLIFKSKLLLINLLKIHNKAVNKNTIATIFSAKEDFPISFLRSLIVTCRAFDLFFDNLKIMFVKKNQTTGNKIKVIGKPILNQSKKPIL